FRIHPYYQWSQEPFPDDVALLELSRPLDLSGPDARAVSLPTTAGRYPPQTSLSLVGFGARGSGGSRGALVALRLSVEPQGICAAPTTVFLPVNAVVFCASSTLGGTCEGDSGAGLVTLGQRPVLLGVLSGSEVACKARIVSVFGFVDAGELRSFIRG